MPPRQCVLDKTTIAQSLGVARATPATPSDSSTLAAALADFLGQESGPAFDRRVRRYTAPTSSTPGVAADIARTTLAFRRRGWLLLQAEAENAAA